MMLPSRRFLATLAIPALVALAVSALAAPAARAEEQAPASPGEDSFLTEVAALMNDAERAAYLALTRDYQRAAFQRAFWAVRDPYPQTARNELAERWHERWRLVHERYPDAHDERATIQLFNGEPNRVLPFRCVDVLKPGEAWIYGGTDRIPTSFVLIFVSTGVSDQVAHRLWSPREGVIPLLAWTLRADGTEPAARLAAEVPGACARGEELLSAIGAASDWSEIARRYAIVPRPNPEWVSSFQALSTDLPPSALPLPGEVEIHFGGRRQSRTVVDASVVVPTAELAAMGAETSPPALVLDGEVLRDDELFDHFRYRFEPPKEALAGVARWPFSARRFLRPGSYRLVLRLQQLGRERYFRSELPLDVPAVSSRFAAGAQTPGASAAAATSATSASPTPPVTPPAPEEPTLTLHAPLDRLVTGRARVEAEVRGASPGRVDFELDGKVVLSKRRAPFSVDLDLGRSPRMRRLRAAAFDDAGDEIAEDEVLINGGPHRFAVRLVEPRELPPGADRLEARAEVDVPEGEGIDRLELYVNDALQATLYQPPYAASLPIVPAELTYVRAVAYLPSGAVAEDVRLLGATLAAEPVDVDFVELYTTVLDRRGHPVLDLGAEDFAVREDGEPQVVRRFERVDELPIHAAVMLDTSSSMLEELPQAEAAAHRFFREVLTPRDRAAVITFADAPRLAVRFTNDVEVLAGGLVDLHAEGETRLYDSLAFALHYFSGVRGKRALVVLTDGADSDSRFKLDEVLEYARRTGVAIYTIGMDVPREPPEAALALDRLARETGGRTFRIGRATELESVYKSIQTELRSQYLLGYQSSHSGQGDGFREVDVTLARPGLEARTIRGYYP